MHKRILNELTIKFTLEPDGPMLIKSGRDTAEDPTLPDLNFVRSTHPRTGAPTVFLPGSSLKGVIRSHAERLARSARPEGNIKWCCDPFTDPCLKGEQKDETTAGTYAHSCAACRTFGNTRLGSHLFLADAYPEGPVTIEQRDGVAIDRVSGAVAAGPFNMEVVTQGRFEATCRWRNFQLWQVGWLAIVLRDLQNGFVTVGSGRSKGLGRVRLKYEQATVSYPGQLRPQTPQHDFGRNLYDVDAFVFEAQSSYKLWPAAVKALPLGAGAVVTEQGQFGRVTTELRTAEAVEALLLAALPAWRQAVEQWQEATV